MAEPRELPAPSIVADLCAQAAWRQHANDDTRKVLELAADTIRSVMCRCVILARVNETSEAEELQPENPCPAAEVSSQVDWQFDIAEGDVMGGPDAALAELNNSDPGSLDYAADLGPFRTLTVPLTSWYGNQADAVEVRAFGRWLVQIADWLEGTK
jgi:hypothetical protein